MKLDSKTDFISYFIRYFIYVIGFVTIFTLSAFIFYSYAQYNHNTEELQSNYLKYQKDLIKNQVLNVFEDINYAVSNSSDKARNIVKRQIKSILEIAHNLYKQNIDSLGIEKTKSIIKETLRAIRYNDGRGYFFAFDLNGNEILNADKPELEGTNLFFIKDLDGHYVIQDMIAIAKNKGEGFYEYTWTKPNKVGYKYKKISYIKYIPELDWVVGTGEYVDDIIEDAKKDVLSKVKKIRFGQSGYIFIFDFDGTYLAHIKKELIGTSRFWYVDKKGIKVGEELLKNALKPEGGFLEYYWPKGKDKYLKKIAYSKAYTPWKWVICAGVFENEVAPAIDENKKTFINYVNSQIFFILMMALFLFFLFYMFTKIYTKSLNNDRNNILKLINEDKINYRINFKFREFHNIAKAIVSYKTEIDAFKEEILRKNKEYLQLIEMMPLPMTIIAEEKFLYVNKEAARLLKADLDKIYNISPLTFVYGDTPCYERLINSTQEIVNGELEIKNLENEILNVDVTSTRITFEGKEATLCVLKDLTEIKSAYEQIKRDKELLSNILSNINDAVIVLNKDGNIIVANQVAENLKSSKDCIEFEKCYQLYDSEKFISDEIDSLIFSDTDLSFLKDKTFILQTGKDSKIVSISLSKLYDKNNDVNGAVVVLRDLTYIISAERHLNKISKIESLGHLAGGIAHNFNNVLAVIMNSLEIIRFSISDNSEIVTLLDNMKETVEKAKSITNQLVTFAKGGKPVKSHFNLNKTVSEVLNISLSGSNIILNIKLYYKPLFVYGDEGQITQVIQNLIINAKQAMDKDMKLLKVITKYTVFEEDTFVDNNLVKKGEYAEIIIEDNGCGISPKDSDKIFDAYFSTKTSGSGLGLSSSLNIVANHQGAITFHSVVGKGTTFRVFLPISKEKKLDDEQKLTKDCFGHYQGILVMDDEDFIRNSLNLMLKHFANDVYLASHGQEAIDILKENIDEIDVAILDLTIPGKMGGVECIKHLKDIKPEILAVVSSGYSDDPVLANYSEYGFDGVLPKPYSFESLKQVLCKIYNNKKS